jgi:O-antigen/teichoic acid export membrane protein
MVNIIGNLILIPRLGYVAAAITTIFSEFCLLCAFYWSVRRNVGKVPWFSVAWRPALAAAAMMITTWAILGFGINVWLATAAGGAVYLLLLIALGALRGGDMDRIWSALPIGPLRRFLGVAPTPAPGAQG